MQSRILAEKNCARRRSESGKKAGTLLEPFSPLHKKAKKEKESGKENSFFKKIFFRVSFLKKFSAAQTEIIEMEICGNKSDALIMRLIRFEFKRLKVSVVCDVLGSIPSLPCLKNKQCISLTSNTYYINPLSLSGELVKE